jgi:type II secretory pathway component GspD/PulD (secretin)
MKRDLENATDMAAAARSNRRQDQAILALMEHPTLERAAASMNISSVTLWRWMQQLEFQKAYREARRRAFGQSVARLQQASSAAVSTLLKIMIDPNVPAASRVRAADSVLNHSAKAIEVEDIEVRVAELERTAQANKEGGGRWGDRRWESSVAVFAGLNNGWASRLPRRMNFASSR